MLTTVQVPPSGQEEVKAEEEQLRAFQASPRQRWILDVLTAGQARQAKDLEDYHVH